MKKMNRQWNGVYFSGLLLAVLPGCSWGTHREIAVELPHLGEYRGELVSWEIAWWDGYAVQTTAVGPGEHPAGKQITLPLDPRGSFLPVVVARPEILLGAGIPLAPYGGWPDAPDDSSGKLVVHRRRGEAALVLLEVAREGLDPALINTARLAYLVEQRGGDEPRRLRTAELREALLERRMRVSRISYHRAPLYQVRTLLEDVPPGGDQWYSDEPLNPQYFGEPAGAYSLFSVPVMNGEVRRLWRHRDRENREVLVIARGLDGNGWSHRFLVAEPPVSQPPD